MSALGKLAERLNAAVGNAPSASANANANAKANAQGQGQDPLLLGNVGRSTVPIVPAPAPSVNTEAKNATSVINRLFKKYPKVRNAAAKNTTSPLLSEAMKNMDIQEQIELQNALQELADAAAAEETPVRSASNSSSVVSENSSTSESSSGSETPFTSASNSSSVVSENSSVGDNTPVTENSSVGTSEENAGKPKGFHVPGVTGMRSTFNTNLNSASGSASASASAEAKATKENRNKTRKIKTDALLKLYEAAEAAIKETNSMNIKGLINGIKAEVAKCCAAKKGLSLPPPPSIPPTIAQLQAKHARELAAVSRSSSASASETGSASGSESGSGTESGSETSTNTEAAEDLEPPVVQEQTQQTEETPLNDETRKIMKEAAVSSAKRAADKAEENAHKIREIGATLTASEKYKNNTDVKEYITAEEFKAGMSATSAKAAYTSASQPTTTPEQADEAAVKAENAAKESTKALEDFKAYAEEKMPGVLTQTQEKPAAAPVNTSARLSNLSAKIAEQQEAIRKRQMEKNPFASASASTDAKANASPSLPGEANLQQGGMEPIKTTRNYTEKLLKQAANAKARRNAITAQLKALTRKINTVNRANTKRKSRKNKRV